MAGNSQRKGAMRKSGTKKGATVGSGGQRRAGLKGKGPTPKAVDRSYHPAAKRKRAAEKRAASSTRVLSTRKTGNYLFGRNPVIEALRAEIPASALYVQSKQDMDERLREALDLAVEQQIPLLEAPRSELDNLAAGGVHQGLLLVVPDYSYADIDELASADLLIALDGITDTRNLGAIARSGAAFGAGGIVLTERRSVAVTAAAWKTSAGALARIPVAQITNLTRTLGDLANDGFITVALDADGDTDLADMRSDILTEPLVVVIGSEGKGVSRLVSETCDWRVRIPMVDEQESLNASVAAAIVLNRIYEARRAAKSAR